MRPFKEAIVIGVIGLICIAVGTWGSGCGGKYTVEVPPIRVDVVHHISTGELLTVFEAQCRRDLGASATTDDINNCAAAKLAQFLDDLGNAINPN